MIGANGGLDIWNAYFPTGNDIADFDLGEVLPDFRSQRRSFADLRTHMRHRVSSCASPVHIALTLLGGDFNYVTAVGDRRRVDNMEPGEHDDAEESHFQKTLGRPLGLHELFQADWTHKNAAVFFKT